jgi:hypothetical protein
VPVLLFELSHAGKVTHRDDLASFLKGRQVFSV